MENNYSDEKSFDEQLNQISELYEASKEGITHLQFTANNEDKSVHAWKAFSNMQKLRDIACNLLKRGHKIESN